jgi:predicted small secreted protein
MGSGQAQPGQSRALMCPNRILGITNMRKNITLLLTLLALVGVAPLLGACHTTAGAGQDLSAGGHAITNSAEKHAP